MRVCLICNYFSPYAIKQYDELGKKIDLTVFAIGGKDANRNDEWDLNGNYSFKTEIIDENFNDKIKHCAIDNDILIDSLYVSKYGIKAVNEFKKEKKKTILLADGGIAKDRGFVINKTMSYLMRRHDYFLSSSSFTNNYFKYYGVDENIIYNYRFSSLSKENIDFNKKLIEDKKNIRKQLNIDDKFTLISVGQPIRRKGFDILLDSYIKTGLTDKINLIIVGGKPQENVKKIVGDNKLSNVCFVDLINSETLKKYYAASDGFILCTREDIWGLVIEEALSFGLPVITSDNCVAGLHFNSLSDCVKICGVNDIDAYAKEIVNLYNNKYNLANKCFDVVKDYTIENSAKDIMDILNRL